MFLLRSSNRNSLITHCTHSEEEDILNVSEQSDSKWPLSGGGGASGLDAAPSSQDELENAGIKSTQLMLLWVNTTHTMGVDAIDKTVGERGGIH